MPYVFGKRQRVIVVSLRKNFPQEDVYGWKKHSGIRHLCEP